MDFLYQCNDKYAPYCGISITSLFENNKDADEINVYILGDEISKESTIKFNELKEKYKRNIVFVDTNGMPEYLDSIGVAPYRNSHTTNFKMFLDKLLPKQIDKILYIDSDTIVDGSLAELFNMDINGKPIAMAQDSLVYKHKIDIGVKENTPYFNAGVILFDMKEWRNQWCEKAILNHIKNVRAHYPAPDQDLINLSINENIYMLPPKYNLEPAYFMFDIKTYYRVFKNPQFYSADVLKESIENPKIYHFFRVMGEFPWHKNNMHPFGYLFDKYMAISPWNDYEKQDSNISVVFKIEKLMYKLLPRFIFAGIFKMAHKHFLSSANKKSLKNEVDKLM